MHNFVSNTLSVPIQVCTNDIFAFCITEIKKCRVLFVSAGGATLFPCPKKPRKNALCHFFICCRLVFVEQSLLYLLLMPDWFTFMSMPRWFSFSLTWSRFALCRYVISLFLCWLFFVIYPIVGLIFLLLPRWFSFVLMSHYLWCVMCCSAFGHGVVWGWVLLFRCNLVALLFVGSLSHLCLVFFPHYYPPLPAPPFVDRECI